MIEGIHFFGCTFPGILQAVLTVYIFHEFDLGRVHAFKHVIDPLGKYAIIGRWYQKAVYMVSK